MSTTAGIEITGLSKSYGPIEAVREIDVSVAPGETVALLGPNGAGKSTTIDMLLGLLEPDAGSISVFGSPPTAAVDRGAVGAMLQTGALLRDLTGRELVSMMAGLYPDPLTVADVLELAGIAHFADQRTQKLSGGQTQRVRFAIALVSIPTCSSWTSRRLPWTSRAATPSGRRCRSSRRKDGRSSSPPTISRRRMRSPIASC